MDIYQNKSQLVSARWHNERGKTSETAEALQTAWLKELEKIFEETVGQMWLEWVNKWANYLTIDNADNVIIGLAFLSWFLSVT